MRDCSYCGAPVAEEHLSRVKVAVGPDLFFCCEEGTLRVLKSIAVAYPGKVHFIPGEKVEVEL
jgi:hypothetical protein